ncbi:hypothetical protein [Acinetobacter sp. SWBY1]|uniref:hypothetical protein n=1 Tax=Acinetobacter sp. SWBY1 TaxID=2079596 RepID=UPI000CF2A8A5|nr:hypothetical protein [Acinetobacter sp. SWBY1]AVH48998.1 hypothetical protein C3Y93_04815 [Acinetobacter sp. SWBY1]
MSTRRATRTPGAKELEPTTQEQADQALEEILNDASEGALVPAEQFDAVAQKLAEAEAKIKALEAQSKATAQPFQSQATEVKRTQNVLTEHGWDSVEE